MLDDLLKAWRTNQRINLFLIEHIDEDGWQCTLSKRGGRNVGRQFSHMHDVRVWHLEKRAKDLAEELSAFASKRTPTTAEVVEALDASSAAIESFLAGVLVGEKGRRGFKKGIFTTLSYFIAHESHHRGSILLTLKQCGRKLDQKVQYGIWDWDRL